ncbi:MAG TPA: hypothetical protein VL992_08375 [Tepidisphaeraceae bacterium]|nr:hypothetical protein [Tepidisphaeraceae bacterium]
MAKSKPQRKPPAKGESSAPSFDTSRAVEEAAALIAGGRSAAPAKPTPRKQSLEFQQLKEGINQPGIQGLDKILDTTGSASSKKSNTPFVHGGNKQVGHNQTFGADVTRSGVPRRTAG